MSARKRLVLKTVAILISLAWAGPAPGEPPASGPSGVIEQVTRGTLGILQDQPAPVGQSGAKILVKASGFHLHDGYLVTARHAVEQEEKGDQVVAKQLTVLTNALEQVPAVLVGVNAYLDVAVYRVTDPEVVKRLPVATFAEREPAPGDPVFTVGYPLGWGPAVAFGRVGNPNIFLSTVDTRLMQLDLSACSGNSGGGLFNEQGEVIGFLHAVIRTETTQGEPQCSRLAFSVPGRLAKRVVTALIQGAQPSFSRLGIALTAVKVGTRLRAAVAEATGPAKEGGLQKGDVLLAIDETEIADGKQLKNYLIERTVPGQKVAVRVRRGDQELVLTVTLGRS
ncbi:S1C family serine protease [Nitrospira sp. Kam-Ns4a]